ncbi:transcriptional repressor [bacterium]|nr:transcriptional repressor [bacterium]
MPFARSTKQRELVLKALQEANRPLSPQEVLDLAKKHLPGIGIATVYRNIKSLLEDQILSLVDLPGNAPRYEICGKHHHHHFLCLDCDKVYELDGCPGDINQLVPRGFKIQDHNITFTGKCRDCARSIC